MARSALSNNSSGNYSNRSINGAIRGEKAMVIDEKGEVIGMMPMSNALQLARSKSLDLIELSRSHDHVVCKIYEYGKYRYEQEKKRSAKNDSKKSKGQKEIQIKVTASDHDTKRKEADIAKLVEEKHRVKVTIVIPGRNAMYPETAISKMQKILDNLSGVAKPESEPKLEGKFLRVVMINNKKQAPQNQQKIEEGEEQYPN